MKIATLLITLLAGAAFSIPHPQAGSSVEILKFSWSKERIKMRPSVSSLASHEELIQQSRRERQLAAARNSADRGAAARLETQIVNHEEAKATAAQTGPSKYGYKYRVTLRNDSTKTIRSIDWDYLFIDPTTLQEMARHQFTSDEILKPGKTKEISVLYPNAPVKTVSAAMLAGNETLPYKEFVIVARILYSDGSSWSSN